MAQDKHRTLRRRAFLAAPAAALLAAAAICWGPRSAIPGCGAGQKEEVARPAKWAAPIEKPGLPNLHRVADGLYRGAQPTAEGFQELAKMGIKTVVSLRWLHSDREPLGNTGLAYEHIYSTPWRAEDEDVVRFLKIATDKARAPVFVHCQHGSDRTGAMCAVYRIAVCGWTKEDAIKEMTDGGFGFHKAWRNLIHYIQDLDVEDIKLRAGIGDKKE